MARWLAVADEDGSCDGSSARLARTAGRPRGGWPSRRVEPESTTALAPSLRGGGPPSGSPSPVSGVRGQRTGASPGVSQGSDGTLLKWSATEAPGTPGTPQVPTDPTIARGDGASGSRHHAVPPSGDPGRGPDRPVSVVGAWPTGRARRVRVARRIRIGGWVRVTGRVRGQPRRSPAPRIVVRRRGTVVVIARRRGLVAVIGRRGTVVFITRRCGLVAVLGRRGGVAPVGRWRVIHAAVRRRGIIAPVGW